MHELQGLYSKRVQALEEIVRDLGAAGEGTGGTEGEARRWPGKHGVLGGLPSAAVAQLTKEPLDAVEILSCACN